MIFQPVDTAEGDPSLGDYESDTSTIDVQSDEKHRCLEEQNPFSSGVPLQRKSRWFYASILEAVLLVGLVSLYYMKPTSSVACPGTTPEIQLPTESLRYRRDHYYGNPNAFDNETVLNETISRWYDFSSDHRGYVSVPEWQEMGLDPPMRTDTMGPMLEGYIISYYHEMHCLAYIFAQYGYRKLGKPTDSIVDEHVIHCIDYMRLSSMCTSDTTLEGGLPYGDWGTHQCRDYTALQSWAEPRMLYNFTKLSGQRIDVDNRHLAQAAVLD